MLNYYKVQFFKIVNNEIIQFNIMWASLFRISCNLIVFTACLVQSYLLKQFHVNLVKNVLFVHIQRIKAGNLVDLALSPSTRIAPSQFAFLGIKKAGGGNI